MSSSAEAPFPRQHQPAHAEHSTVWPLKRPALLMQEFGQQTSMLMCPTQLSPKDWSQQSCFSLSSISWCILLAVVVMLCCSAGVQCRQGLPARQPSLCPAGDLDLLSHRRTDITLGACSCSSHHTKHAVSMCTLGWSGQCSKHVCCSSHAAGEFVAMHLGWQVSYFCPSSRSF